MRKPVADHQQHIIDFIQQYLTRYGYPPSVREIGAAVGLKSTASVARYLKRLEQEGRITHPPMKRRAWAVTGDTQEVGTVPLVGKITAGQPILADEHVEERWRLPSTLFHPHADYLLRVIGDSMIDAGIREGDLVAVESTTSAQNGDIVIALIGDEATVKYIDLSHKPARLLPANPRYTPIIDPAMTVIGRVVGLIRSY